MNLKDVLTEYVGTITLGSSDQTAHLRAGLRRVLRRNEIFFATAVGACVLMFMVAVALIVQHSGDGAVWASTSAIFGISLVGMVRLMLQMWREKVSTELLLEISTTDDDVLRRVSRVLLDRMAGESRGARLNTTPASRNP